MAFRIFQFLGADDGTDDKLPDEEDEVKVDEEVNVVCDGFSIAEANFCLRFLDQYYFGQHFDNKDFNADIKDAKQKGYDLNDPRNAFTFCLSRVNKGKANVYLLLHIIFNLISDLFI